MSRGGGATGALVAVAGLWLLSAVVLAALPRAARAPSVAAVALVSVPLAAATVVAYVRRARVDRVAVVVVAAVGAVILAAASWLDVTPAAALGKVLLAASVGLAAAALLDEAWNVALIALLVTVVDIYSVFRGPTKRILEDEPDVLSALTVPLAAPGREGGALIGVTDFVFLALFCAAALRWALRPRLTVPLCVASLSVTIVLATAMDRALPALPLLAVAFVVPNLRALHPGGERPRDAGPA